MIVYDLVDAEDNPTYRALEITNGLRLHDFLKSYLAAAFELQRPLFSNQLIRALNFHAIACLHSYAGEYRPCRVIVGEYVPPDWHQVHSLMEDFINEVNWNLRSLDPIVLSTYVLWKLNQIHPFINGNGRTARACAYYILCLGAGHWISGTKILPELLKRERPRLVQALKAVDASAMAGRLDLEPLHSLVCECLSEQLESVQVDEAE